MFGAEGRCGASLDVSCLQVAWVPVVWGGFDTMAFPRWFVVVTVGGGGDAGIRTIVNRVVAQGVSLANR